MLLPGILICIGSIILTMVVYIILGFTSFAMNNIVQIQYTPDIDWPLYKESVQHLKPKSTESQY